MFFFIFALVMALFLHGETFPLCGGGFLTLAIDLFFFVAIFVVTGPFFISFSVVTDLFSFGFRGVVGEIRVSRFVAVVLTSVLATVTFLTPRF